MVYKEYILPISIIVAAVIVYFGLVNAQKEAEYQDCLSNHHYSTWILVEFTENFEKLLDEELDSETEDEVKSQIEYYSKKTDVIRKTCALLHK